MKNILFGTVIYPQSIPYLDDFLNSINNQTYKDFDLLVINDGIDRGIVNHKFQILNRKARIFHNDQAMSPVNLRIYLLEKAKEVDADILIFGDSDDWFSDDRVEDVVDSFGKFKEMGFVYNDLYLESNELAFPKVQDKIDNVECIEHYNFLGLSNTAVRMNLLEGSFIKSLQESNSFVFDWYFFSRLLLDGRKGIKAKNAKSIYRIYDNNYVGIQKDDADSVNKEVAVKLNLYKLLKKYCPLYSDLYYRYLNGKFKHVGEKSTGYWWSLTI